MSSPPSLVIPNIWPFSCINFFFLPEPELNAQQQVVRWQHTPKEIGKGNCSMTINEYVVRHLQWSVWGLLGWIAYVTGPPVAAATEWNFSWIFSIILRDLVICNICYGCWHWLLNYSFLKKKIQPYMYSDKYPPDEQTGHDFFYTNLGILHGAVIEIILYRLWATNQLPVLNLFRTFAPNISGGYYEEFWLFPVWSLIWTYFVPYWREFHFYWCHRVMHPWRMQIFGIDLGSLLYKKFHSLHHKSYNPNSWSGMSMHPVEHVFYFSCIWIHFLIVQHPFHFLFNKYHLMISPIPAGHDGLNGYFHWLHHAHYECNYGTPGIPFDKWFGTFQDGSKWSKTGVK